MPAWCLIYACISGIGRLLFRCDAASVFKVVLVFVSSFLHNQLYETGSHSDASGTLIYSCGHGSSTIRGMAVRL